MLFTIVTLSVGWIFKVIFNNIKENAQEAKSNCDKLYSVNIKLQEDLTTLALSIPEKYVRKDEFHNFADRMDDRFDKLEEKIDELGKIAHANRRKNTSE